MDYSSTIRDIAIMALPVVIAVVFHEVAHGYMALLKGDDTAKRMGRLTLNPIKHMDPFGTVILPILFYLSTSFLFAYAKPVPVSFAKLRRPKQDMVWVAAAGPVTNLILAGFSALLIKIIFHFNPDLARYIFGGAESFSSGGMTAKVIVPIIMMLLFSLKINVVLAIINLIPVPPADGGRIAVGLLPMKLAYSYSKIEPFGMFILIFLLFVNPLGFTHKILLPIISSIINWLL